MNTPIFLWTRRGQGEAWLGTETNLKPVKAFKVIIVKEELINYRFRFFLNRLAAQPSLGKRLS